MAFDPISYALSKGYTEETAEGMGALVGPMGPAGEDGVSPTVSVTDITGGHRITITDATGPHTFDVMDGEDGTDGISPTITVTEISGGHRVTITDATGAQSFDVMDGTGGGGSGEKGDPGTTFTPAVSEDGVISWTNDGGLTNPPPVNIMGPAGADGTPGPKGDPGNSPYIGDNGNWWVGDTDTGVSASGGGGSGGGGGGVPKGIISIWSGAANNIPTGWQLCDGTNNTPDLRDKFVLGAGTSHEAGSTGGSETVTLSVDQMPEHNHDIGNTPSPKKLENGNGSYNATLLMNTTGETFTKETGSSQPHNNMPPYYTLCYIICMVEGGGSGGSSINAGDGLTKDGDTLNVDNPVRGICTQDEFDALTDDQKSSGTYIVDDGKDGGQGGGSAGEIYSTEETKIGTWIDGKPLYRISKQGVLPNGQANTLITIFSVSNVDTMISATMSVKKGNIQVSVPNYASSIRIDGEQFQLYGHNDAWLMGGNYTAVVLYTKTTDQATVTHTVLSYQPPIETNGVVEDVTDSVEEVNA